MIVPESKVLDTIITITGKVEEHLVLGKKEWFSIRLENGQVITINRKFCKEKENDK